jgi:hypothetical protein
MCRKPRRNEIATPVTAFRSQRRTSGSPPVKLMSSTMQVQPAACSACTLAAKSSTLLPVEAK